MPLHVSSICAHHQEIQIALHGLWYHHTEIRRSKLDYIASGIITLESGGQNWITQPLVSSHWNQERSKLDYIDSGIITLKS